MMKVIYVKKRHLSSESDGHEQYKVMWGDFQKENYFYGFFYLNDYIPQAVGYLMVHFWIID